MSVAGSIASSKVAVAGSNALKSCAPLAGVFAIAFGAVVSFDAPRPMSDWISEALSALL